ncbi:Hypothetical predicted protein [Paramuricea clavata]|uniref:Uncharacterized protein n=1 Tax=Paramuricea clavata TaxID=317549 RepID=A0A6S7G9I9_PARCT|nr:Hypothetical predicted protein [Paramuricea clavata]
MEKLFENKKLNVGVRTVRRGEEVLFYAKDVSESLGYNKPRNAVRIHVWEEDKCTLGSLQRGPSAGPLYMGQPETVLITEQGLYQLIFGSELKHAKNSRRWVFNEILPSIRKTGWYELPKSKLHYSKQLKLLNETDLHYAVVRYIRRYYPNALIVAGLGEYQDTVQRRCDAYRKGYIGGQPDLIIKNPMNGYIGFAMELKTPKGTDETKLNLSYLTSRMADKPEQTQVPVTSEKKKDPRRVAAGKRLAAISKIEKERKRKQAEPNESPSNDSVITYIGVAIALISLVLAYKSHEREEKALEPEYVPQTVTIVK